MAQKTNPIGLRLGLTQVWDLALQNYGGKNKFYSNFILKQITLNNFLQYYLYSKASNFIDKAYVELDYKNIVLRLSYTAKELAVNAQQLNFDERKVKEKLETIHICKTRIEIFHNYNFFITANLVAFYVKSLCEQKFSLKSIMLNLENFLKDNLDATKIVVLKNGVSVITFKGFRLRISGRFENTRNGMAKSYEQSYGSLSLIRLKNYVEFCSQPIFTKLGTCTFQVCLFYEIKDAN
uniref:Ribosomal protein S3 n=1 Tax=Gelidiella flabella TaxID=2026927 RepID=A0A7G9IW69_9FLOR|nr:ribosomal protein S3 [Gelidiella flabella]QNM39613.1 ribosomal protein S3 [Gelidiella flabella]